MSSTGARYMFAGHATGAAARFHRLDDVADLNHVVPTQGAVALPSTGGRSEAHVNSRYEFRVDHPRPRCLMAVDRVSAWVEGRDPGGRKETEFGAEVDGFEVLEKLRIDAIRLHVLAVRRSPEEEAEVSTRGSQVAGLRMGRVTAHIDFDDEPLGYTGSQDRLARFWREQTPEYRERNCHRFCTTPDGRELAADHGRHRFSLVRAIRFAGPEKELAEIWVEDGYTIRWKGFGRIILGEVHVKGQERRVSLVRLAMGSDGGGDGGGGEGGSNGGNSSN